MKRTMRFLAISILCLSLVGLLLGCSAKQANQNPAGPGNSDITSPGDSTGGNTGNNSGDNAGGNEGVNQEQKPGNNQDPSGLKQYDGLKGKILDDDYPAEIAAYLDQNKEIETQQAFNINNKTYLVLTMGQKPSAGYRIELVNLALKDGKLIVEAKYVKPGKDEMVATVITYPSLVIETDDIYEGHYLIEYKIAR